MILIGYKVNDRLHTNAFQAWDDILTQRHNRTLREFYLYLNNDIYDHLEWHRAPTKSIAVLEEEHALKLRQTYDYIRLWFSGGSDSQSIMDAFLRSGQCPDEIVMVNWETLGTDNLNSPRGLTTRRSWLIDRCARYHRAVPKVTVLDVGERHLEQYFSDRYYYNQAGYGGTGTFSIAHVSECSKYIADPPVANYCDLFGYEKPRIHIEGTKAYLQMNDRLLMSGMTYGLPIEWFYLPRLTPDLVRAQLWGVLNFARTHHGVQGGEFVKSLQTDKALYHAWCTLCGRITTAEQNRHSVEAKNVGRSDDLTNPQTYIHLQQYRDSRPSSWHHYVTAGGIERELAQTWGCQGDLPGIITKPYFLTDFAVVDQ